MELLWSAYFVTNEGKDKVIIRIRMYKEIFWFVENKTI